MKTLARDERKPFYKMLLFAGMVTTMVTLTFFISSCLAFGPSGYGQDWNGYYPSHPGDNNGSTGSYLDNEYRPIKRDGQANRIVPNRQYRPTGTNKQKNRSSPQVKTADQQQLKPQQPQQLKPQQPQQQQPQQPNNSNRIKKKN
jgi:hypothetical protein